MTLVISVESAAAGQIMSSFSLLTAIARWHSGRITERKYESGAQKHKIQRLKEQLDQDILKANTVTLPLCCRNVIR